MGSYANGRKRRVLIIEDNVDAAESLSLMLEFYDQTVEVAFNGPDGLAAAHRFQPDVVLCDLGLPGMDGLHVAQAMRADPALSATRLIALTGYSQREDIQRALEAGFTAHLTKPADPEQLIRVLGA